MKTTLAMTMVMALENSVGISGFGSQSSEFLVMATKVDLGVLGFSVTVATLRSQGSQSPCGIEMSYAVPVLPLHAPPFLDGSLSSTSHNSSTVGGESSEGSNRVEMKPAVNGYKWRLVISYEGTKYAGWQYQVSPPTVQCFLEKALNCATKLERKDLCLVGGRKNRCRSSRVRPGPFQVAHFVTPFNYGSLDGIHAALNGILPDDIRVREISPAVPEFHARFSAEGKTYHYKIYNDAVMDPMQRHFAYHSACKLNADVMREAAKHFVGIHNFSAFANTSNSDRVRNPVKSIFRFDVVEMGALLQLEVEGSGFLYRQVRNMVALLLQVGREALPPDIVPSMLASQDRRELAKYVMFAPPHGLCLVNVMYNKDHLRLPPDCPTGSFGKHHTITKCKLPFY
ncbi:hypothetical protein F8388_015309 [Cannabis sativa]|uniref:tRNA pseudouridine synthase n=1 Tax=Cannabis sativa TaxID=3483 RepID=A0A7J6F1X3_CANSA|nr:hypothetical protein F8388_015309 [Cannabis sativa]